MFTIKHLTAGQEDYYLNVRYYVSGHATAPEGVWIGSARSSLELSGTVKEEPFKRMTAGYHPITNKPLVRNAGKMTGDRARQPGWDGCYSAPKSVSVLWSQASDTLRHDIERCQQDAVETAFAYLEKNAAFSRVGKGGREDSSEDHSGHFRPYDVARGTGDGKHDVQLHTHVVVPNIGVSKVDGKSQSIVSQMMYEHQLAAGAEGLRRGQFLCSVFNGNLPLDLWRRKESCE